MSTEEDRIGLYLSLFRGREDVYARRWENQRTGKSGYAPACRDLPFIVDPNTGKRKRQDPKPEDYLPFTKAAFVDGHLGGAKTLGVYPLLCDNTCWFLAFDHDGEHAFDEVTKLKALCDQLGLPAYVERSRSGNFHLWLFFTAPIAAWKARRVGFALLNKAGISPTKLGKIASFDRMIPNQDVLSGKKFGNLIALPLQGESVLRGRTEFLDPSNEFNPYENQWDFLTTIRRISEEELLAVEPVKSIDWSPPPPPAPEREKVSQRVRLFRKILSRSDAEKEEGLEQLRAGCTFVQHCEFEAATLPEPAWWALASNLAAFGEPGRHLFHKLSQPYPTYSREEADKKFDRALADPKPHRCSTIRDKIWDCGRDCGVKSPCALPFKKMTTVAPTTAKPAPAQIPPLDLDTLIDAIAADTDRKDLSGKLQPILVAIAALVDSIERERFIQKIHDRFTLPLKALRQTIDRMQSEARRKEEEERKADDPGDRHALVPKVIEKDGVYLGVRGYDTQGNPIYEVFTDFVIRIRNTIHTPKGCVRAIAFVKNERESGPFIMEPADMSSPRDFLKFCNASGFFNFTGTATDLYHLWALIQAGDPGKLVYHLDHVGYVAKDDLWLFKNVAIQKGKILKPDEEGIFWLEKRGIVPISLDYVDDESEKVPSIEIIQSGEVDSIGSNLLDALSTNLGGYRAHLGLGWAIATCFMPEITRRYGCFPILYLYGKPQCGKNTLAAWLLRLFGIRGEARNLSESTLVGVSRRLAYYSCLPVWFDEYRNEKRVVLKDGLLRDAYNQVGVTKGVALEFGTREVPARGAVLLSGEQLPADNGLRSRLVVNHLTKLERVDAHYWDVEAAIAHASAYTANVLRQKDPEAVKHFLSLVAGFETAFKDRVDDARLAVNYAIVTGGLMVIRHEPKFVTWLEGEIGNLNREKESESLVGGFIEDIDFLKATGVITPDFYAFDQKSRQAHLWFAAVYNLWATDYRKRTGEPAWPKKSILDQFKEEPYFVSHGESERIAGQSRHVLTFNFDKLPEILVRFFMDLPPAGAGRRSRERAFD